MTIQWTNTCSCYASQLLKQWNLILKLRYLLMMFARKKKCMILDSKPETYRFGLLIYFKKKKSLNVFFFCLKKCGGVKKNEKCWIVFVSYSMKVKTVVQTTNKSSDFEKVQWQPQIWLILQGAAQCCSSNLPKNFHLSQFSVWTNE